VQIKRPYFHVKPLEKGQLKNWKDYLDYEIEQGDRDRIIVLFERCLIACALYDEYWTKVSFQFKFLVPPKCICLLQECVFNYPLKLITKKYIQNIVSQR